MLKSPLPGLSELADTELIRIKEGITFATSFQQREIHRFLLLTMDPELRTNNDTFVGFRTTVTDKALLERIARKRKVSTSKLIAMTLHDAIPHIYN
jgi:hypothetical protein